MKKLFIFLIFTFCAGFVFARSGADLVNQIRHNPIKTVQPKKEMRVFVKDGEEIITNFDSAYLKSAPKIHIVFAQQTDQERKPIVYIISDEEIDKTKIQTKLPAYFDKYFFGQLQLKE